MRLPMLLFPAVLWLAQPVPVPAPAFTRLYQLKPDEGVFAYARISPDGNQLAYASELHNASGNVISQTVTLVDLPTKKVLFTERGIDAYFSTDGERIIYSSSGNGVTIRHADGRLVRDPALNALGDYYSWGMRDGRNLILTITSNYYYLNGDKAVLPHAKVDVCPVIGRGDRPLLSKDGKMITTFVRGTVVVRNLTDCNFTFDTGLQGAKADFSWDSRYIAFHVARTTSEDSYDIAVIDLKDRTIRRITSALPGSSYFPSWTKDGRLCFRYDGPDYQGFMMASEVLTSKAEPLPAVPDHFPAKRAWRDIFPETALPATDWVMVLIWAPWSAHMPEALAAAQTLNDRFAVTPSNSLKVLTAVDPASGKADVTRLRGDRITLTQIPLSSAHMQPTGARNQIPTSLLFYKGQVVDQHLGPMTMPEMLNWMNMSRSLVGSK